MTTLISFWVEGKPRAKQSFRVGNGVGYQSARVKSWQNAVGWEAQKAMRARGFQEPLAGHFTATLYFFMDNARRVDWENLSKCVQDGLNGVVWIDDKQSIRGVVDKYVCREKPGVFVRVESNDRPVEVSAAQIPLIVNGMMEAA